MRSLKLREMARKEADKSDVSFDKGNDDNSRILPTTENTWKVESNLLMDTDEQSFALPTPDSALNQTHIPNPINVCERNVTPVTVINMNDIESQSRIRFQCNQCEKSYAYKQLLKKHCISIHCYTSEQFILEYPRPGFKSIPKTNFPVTTASYTTPSRSITKRRRKRPVTFEDLFVLKQRFSRTNEELKEDIICQCCGLNFNKQSDFTSHVQKKHQAKFRRSFEDGLIPKRRVTLTLTRSDSIEKDLMSESSSSGDSLEASVDGEQFPCRFCGRCFELKANKIVHERLHTGENPFQCTVCDKSFACFTYLTSHLELTHNLLKG